MELWMGLVSSDSITQKREGSEVFKIQFPHFIPNFFIFTIGLLGIYLSCFWKHSWCSSTIRWWFRIVPGESKKKILFARKTLQFGYYWFCTEPKKNFVVLWKSQSILMVLAMGWREPWLDVRNDPILFEFS